jgi:SNF2 family DNA or RNA helicase
MATSRSQLLEFYASMNDLFTKYEGQVPSNKIIMLLDIIAKVIARREKILIFSRTLDTLKYIQDRLTEEKIAYFRVDGKVAAGKRKEYIDAFNMKNGPRVFLISSGACSEGVNLHSANRVIIMEPGWNPVVDDQSIARVYRFGQTKPVYVYRFVTLDTIEEHKQKLNTIKTNRSL